MVVISAALWFLVPINHKELSTLGQSMRDVFLAFCSALGGHQSLARHWLGAAPTRVSPPPPPGVSRALSWLLSVLGSVNLSGGGGPAWGFPLVRAFGHLRAPGRWGRLTIKQAAGVFLSLRAVTAREGLAS